MLKFSLHLLCPVLLSLACSEGGRGTGTNVVADSKFEGFDLSPERFEGTWVFPGVFEEPTAWSIESGQITQVTSDGTRTGKFSVFTPCSVRLSYQEGTRDAETVFNYARDERGLFLGSRATGARSGAKIAVCGLGVRSDVYIVEEGNCTRWRDLYKVGWKSKSVSCERNGNSVTIEDDFSGTLSKMSISFDGEILLSDELRMAGPAERLKTLEEAKSKIGLK